SWKSSDKEVDDDNEEGDDVRSDDDETKGQDDQEDDDDEKTNSDNDGDEFVHPKFSTHDDEERQDDEEDSFDPRVHTPSRVKSTDDDEIQGGNVQGTKLNEEATNKEEVGNELYKDVNVNLAGQDTEMTDAP
ncbi:hypothetical protein Tco_0470180, partial [Tanacetum coccineum]